MESAYAEDIDQTDVFREWQMGRVTPDERARAFTRMRSAPVRSRTALRRSVFLRPDVAIVQVPSHRINGGNIGTDVPEKQKGSWITGANTMVREQHETAGDQK
jgi:hypothetical protein